MEVEGASLSPADERIWGVMSSLIRVRGRALQELKASYGTFLAWKTQLVSGNLLEFSIWGHSNLANAQRTAIVATITAATAYRLHSTCRCAVRERIGTNYATMHTNICRSVLVTDDRLWFTRPVQQTCFAFNQDEKKSLNQSNKRLK